MTRHTAYKLILRIPFLAIVLTCSLFAACSKTEQVAEAPPAYQPSPPAPAPDLPDLPPKSGEVEAAVKRIFKDSAVLASTHEPNFISGDFNGDQSQDLVVVLKPVPGKLDQLNDEYPAWILNDPAVVKRPGMSPLHIEQSDVLLAIIHGYGPNDWRDPEATQTYLFKNAVGTGLKTNLRAEFVAANAAKKIPKLYGDLIAEVRNGSSTFLYYTGSTYSWYDPKTFKGEPEKRLVHGGQNAKVRN